jgi:glycogen phosphorylase
MIDQTLAAKIPERIKRLNELAHNLWWAWHPVAREVFRSLDYPLWRDTRHNPVKILCDISPERLKSASNDPAFLSIYDAAVTDFDAELNAKDGWFARHYADRLRGPVVYFSMEFALHSSLPIYAGGLGVLAGDMCKEASDLGLPFTGVGFMYPQGYFHQHVSADGWQVEIFQHLNFQEAPISKVVNARGEPLITQVALGNRSLSIATWQVKVGRVTIYLLDTNVEENSTDDRQLSARLYTADPEIRIQQEITLGIGGVRLLRALGVQPAVWHANEGHSAFMSLERMRELVEGGLAFDEALKRVRQTTIFTTHTPMPSGHDAFTPELITKYFADYRFSLGIDEKRFFALGQPDTRGQSCFNMTALAINTAKKSNAVSRLHEIETKKMWRTAWPDLSADQLPITYVTNGVHVPSWIGLEFTQLFDKYLGPDWPRKQDDPDFWWPVFDIPDEELWNTHIAFKNRLIEIIMARAQARWADGDATAQQVVTMGALLNPKVLTVCFSRRFTEYKRPSLVFRDIDRLKKIVNNPRNPVQIIFAGKSHPADFSGKYLLHTIYAQAQDREFQGRIAFVEDYDMNLARYLVHGADVWLNNPRRFQEASGTSGMKAGINGVLNLSVRDGWWDDGYDGENGWAIGVKAEESSMIDQETSDAEDIYRLLEEKIVPLYYNQDRAGIPHEWTQMVKKSICSILPEFSACRMVKEYVEKLYLNDPDGQ